MEPIIPSAVLCPTRVNDRGELEVLLTRRAFWNYQKDRPMRYPGEWSFCGGIYEDCDKNLLDTAIREFTEEMGYHGPIDDTMFIRSATKHSYGQNYCVESYSARIDCSHNFTLTEKGEVIGLMWIRPDDAIRLIRSGDFTREQLSEFRKKGLDNPEFGIYRAFERKLPSQNIKTLEMIHSIADKLIGIYG
jgi:8-oxo-dGTP pyrophosphatase MutT (NUDIX family)